MKKIKSEARNTQTTPEPNRENNKNNITMKRFLFCLMAALAFVGCTDEGPDDGSSTQPQPQTAITLTTTALNFTTEGGSQNVTFTSSGDWTAQVLNDRANDWCKLTPASGAAGNGQITVTAAANATTDERSASIILKSGTVQKTIKVTQKQKDALTVTASKFEVAAEGGTVAIEVKANVDFSYSVDDASQSWIKYQTTRAMKTSTLVFDIAENDSRDKRQGTVTISSGALKEVVTIYQEGAKPTIVISKSEYVIGSEGGSVAVEVKSNVDVSVELPSDVEWLSESTTRAMSTNTYYFDVAENTGYDQRSATIVFTNKADNLTEEVTITQAQKDAIVLAKSEYEIGADGGALDFEIQTNVDVTVKTSATWIKQVMTRALESKMLFFDIAANDAQEAREGTITLSGGDVTQTIIVKQSNAQPSNEIWYISSNGEIVWPVSYNAFGASIVSNTYENGKGIIRFDQAVTGIGENAFLCCESLTSITIPNSVTSIGFGAFGRCLSLTSFNIPDSVTSIEAWAFGYCSSLTSINIPDSVTSIGYAAFSGCSSLKEFKGKFASTDSRCLIIDSSLIAFAPAGLTEYTIPDSVTSIGEYAFDDCSSLTSINIPNSVTSIGRLAFSGCSSLTSINIPNSVTYIGEMAFSGCSRLTSITIPDSMTSIEAYAFYNCSSLTSITIPNSVTSIGEMAFSGCSRLTSITLPNGVTSIGKDAFSFCSRLTSITLPDSVTSIEASAFSYCSSLTSITIPNSVTSIGSGVFAYCSSLKEFKGKFASADSRCLIIDNSLIAFAPAGLTEYTIPDSVTSIGEYAFDDCSSLTSINIPNSVTSIGRLAFSGCSSLTSINIPNSVTYIGEMAFSGCSRLTSITIPDSMTSIEAYAFYNCSSLTSITIPNSVTSIGEMAFSGCSRLTSITLPNGVTSIGKDAFSFCSRLTSITLPDSVTSIEASAFSYCSSLTSITIPNSVTSIGSWAFSDCSSLQDIICNPTNPPTGGSQMFSWISSSAKIYVPTGSGDAYKVAKYWSDYWHMIVEM